MSLAGFVFENHDLTDVMRPQTMVDLIESDREHWVLLLEALRDSGRFSREIECNGFCLTLVVTTSGAMIVVRDPDGHEAIVKFSEVYYDAPEGEVTFDDDEEGLLSIVRLKAAMDHSELCSVTHGGRSVLLSTEGELRIVMNGQEVRVTPDLRVVPCGVPPGEIYAAVERLRVAAEAYLSSTLPTPPPDSGPPPQVSDASAVA